MRNIVGRCNRCSDSWRKRSSKTSCESGGKRWDDADFVAEEEIHINDIEVRFFFYNRYWQPNEIDWFLCMLICIINKLIANYVTW